MPVRAVAAWWFDNPRQKVVPGSRIPSSTSHLSTDVGSTAIVLLKLPEMSVESLDEIIITIIIYNIHIYIYMYTHIHIYLKLEHLPCLSGQPVLGRRHARRRRPHEHSLLLLLLLFQGEFIHVKVIISLIEHSLGIRFSFYISRQTCIHLSLSLYIYIYTYTYMCVYTYIYIYIYTHSGNSR